MFSHAHGCDAFLYWLSPTCSERVFPYLILMGLRLCDIVVVVDLCCYPSSAVILLIEHCYSYNHLAEDRIFMCLL